MNKKDETRCCIPDQFHDARCDPAPSEPERSGAYSAILPDKDTIATGGDWFEMGSAESPYPPDGESPVRSVWVDSFSLSATAVTNLEFKRFVDATGYETEAERFGSSFVFDQLLIHSQKTARSAGAPWWRDTPGAFWKTPEGVGSSIESRLNHPVVHVTHTDALQYCRWSRTRLPTEAEWEFAARGGLTANPFPWGEELLLDGVHHCNIWQGEFPNNNTLADGYLGTAPVTEYAANAFGFYNMTGNVWEWVADRFTRLHSPRKVRNPVGPLNGGQFVAKGGSYLCHESYCYRYRTSSRQALAETASAGNLGFRVAKNI